MRITKIHLRDFRGFPGEFDIHLPQGSSLLVYGENGSGKSSLAIALRDFISLDRPFPRPIAPYAYAFPGPTARQPRVQLDIEEAGTTETITWETLKPHPLQLPDGATPASTTPAMRESLTGVSRQSGFYDYRVLLRTSYRVGGGDLGEQLFLLFVENLLAGFPLVAGGGEFVGEQWGLLKRTIPSSRRKLRMKLANRVALPLNQALPGFLDRTRIEANRLLETYFPNQRLTIQALYTPGCAFAKDSLKLTGQTIQPEIEYNGYRVHNHEEFLNEARLTALGLCMFLAALKLADSNPTAPDPLRLLVLDDVLIGLDLSNRLPLLECLRVEFPHHQTILLTYDDLWFKIASEHVKSWGTWISAQMYAELTGPTDPPIPRYKGNVDDLVVAQRHLDASDLRASAVYVRSAFESRIRKVSEDNHLKTAYKQDAKYITADALWTLMLTHHNSLALAGVNFLDPALIPRINAVRSNVLNRLVHDGGVGLTRPDLQDAINTMKAFRACEIPQPVVVMAAP